MESIFILIPIALVFTGIAVAAFFWAVNSGQYDDLDKSANDILFDDEPASGQDDKPVKPIENPTDND